MPTPALQRLTSSPRSVSAVIHVVGLLLFAASFSWLPNITNPLHNGFGGSYQFLTFIALTMSTVTFAVGLVADVVLQNDQGSLAAAAAGLKNMLSVCATPLEVLVSVLYWGLRAVDKRFVVPPGHEVPFVPDFGFHAVPAVMLVLDLMLLSPPWSIRGYGAMAVGSLVGFAYWAWLEYCFSFNGWYPYPLLAQLSTWQKLFLCITSAALMTASTMVLKWVYGRINGVEELRRDAFNNPIINVKVD